MTEKREALLKVAAYAEFVKAREFKTLLEKKYKGRAGHFYLLGDADDSSRMGKWNLMPLLPPCRKLWKM